MVPNGRPKGQFAKTDIRWNGRENENRARSRQRNMCYSDGGGGGRAVRSACDNVAAGLGRSERTTATGGRTSRGQEAIERLRGASTRRCRKIFTFSRNRLRARRPNTVIRDDQEQRVEGGGALIYFRRFSAFVSFRHR